jgi:hypothetical protein
VRLKFNPRNPWLIQSLAFIGILAATMSLAGTVFRQQRPAVWIGVGFTAEGLDSPPEGTKAKSGLRIGTIAFNSPAEKGGLLIGDLIVGADGQDFEAEPGVLDKQFRESILQRNPGDGINLRIIRDGQAMDIRLIVGPRSGEPPVKEYSFPKINWPEEELGGALIDEFKVGDGYQDLRQRLARLSGTGDRFRLSRVAYVQREPFQLRTVAGRTFDEVAATINQRNPQAGLSLAAEWLDAHIPMASPLKTGLTFEQHLDQLVDVLREARLKRDQAFANLMPEDQKFFEDNCDALFAAFSEDVDLASDRNRDTRRRNARLLELATRVDFVKLFEGAQLLWRVGQDDYLDDLESALRKAWAIAGKPEGIFINRDSPIGKILVGGNGSSWYTEDAAIVLDLGGNDFYTNNAGSARGAKLTAALLIDFAGDDAYEATFDWTQGAARMGYSVLIDRKGNDEYIGRAWAQGAAVLGAALFLDESGNDTYRAVQYAQGTAAWGIALHIDYEGDDMYEAGMLSQAVALPGGAGWLLDGSGNDTYYSKGVRSTAYGNPGIFDSWSQGSAIGFRGMQSGGVALLYDGAGKDRYEAGNFSQGGGYYFGVGMLRDAGNENDVYIGSHYNQGFAAHQAIGFFEDIGGDDFYTTRHAVAQGTAWDEAIAVFIDHAGDDVYEGGESYSQGASAHSGFCLFLDLEGRNRFKYGLPQGFAGPNTYHDGNSFSLFVAANDRDNSPAIRLNGEYGFFADLRDSIENALKTKSWRSLIKKD